MSDVNDIVQQLVDQINSAPPEDKPTTLSQQAPTPEQLESFIISRATSLVDESMFSIDKIKKAILAAPNAEDVEALSKLITSSATAMEVLNKILITNKKASLSVQLKQIDAQNKKQSIEQEGSQNKLTMNREELLKQLIADAKLIDITEANP